MECRRMGRSGLKVSELCLGTMTFGHGTEQEEANRIVGLALDADVNFFDTANSHGNGQSEVMPGNALKGKDAVGCGASASSPPVARVLPSGENATPLPAP